MDRVSFLPFFLQSFPESLVVIALGMAWTGAKAEWKSVMCIACLGAILSYGVRALPIFFGVHTLIHFVFLVSALRFWLKQSWSISLVAVLLGCIALGLAEGIIGPFISYFNLITLADLLANAWLRLFVFLPHLALLGLLAFYSRKRNWVIVSLNAGRMEQAPLLIIVCLQIFLIVAMNAAFSAYRAGVFASLKWEHLVFLPNIILITAAITTILVAKKVLGLNAREAVLEERARNLEASEEVYRAVRTYRHDFNNHITALYGFLQMGDMVAARKYMEILYKEIKQSNTLINLGIPALSGLLHTKKSIAKDKGIDLLLCIDAGFALIPLNPVELTGVVGNLIDNALDAVLHDNPYTPQVRVDLLYAKREQTYLIEVSNTGSKPPQEVTQRMFTPGFSTKSRDRHSGLGLTSVKNVVNRYNGQIKAEYDEEKNSFILRLCIPDGAKGQ